MSIFSAMMKYLPSTLIKPLNQCQRVFELTAETAKVQQSCAVTINVTRVTVAQQMQRIFPSFHK